MYKHIILELGIDEVVRMDKDKWSFFDGIQVDATEQHWSDDTGGWHSSLTLARSSTHSKFAQGIMIYTSSSIASPMSAIWQHSLKHIVVD